MRYDMKNYKECLVKVRMQMLAAGIKYLLQARLSQLHPFVDEATEIERLPNPSVSLQTETPSGPSSQMVLF